MFNATNKTRMQQGLAPKVMDNQNSGSRSSYELYHNTPTNQGGNIYIFDNLTIVTPRYHKEILSPTYHYGYGY